MNDGQARACEELRRALVVAICPELLLEPWQRGAIAHNAASSLAGSSKRLRTGPGITEDQVRGVLARYRREIATAASGDETDRVAMANRIAGQRAESNSPRRAQAQRGGPSDAYRTPNGER